MIFRQHDKRISRAKAIDLYGKARLERRVETAKRDFLSNPLEPTRWLDGFSIEIEGKDFGVIEINGIACQKIDQWEEESCLYILGQDIEDEQFFYALAFESMQEFKGKYIHEFDREPTKQEVEDRHVSHIAAIAIDRNEAEVM